MSLRLTTTANDAISTAWQPTAETVLQLDALCLTAVVEIQARVHADAPWTRIAGLDRHEPIKRLAQVPSLRLVVISNDGRQISVWDNA